tara:strand:- start:4241 stop:5179 length:939 start_codon:yes stop_codon:yes gene_type:complete
MQLSGWGGAGKTSLALQFGNDYHDLQEKFLPNLEDFKFSAADNSPFRKVLNAGINKVLSQETREEEYTKGNADQREMMETSGMLLDCISMPFFKHYEELFWGVDGYAVAVDDKGPLLEREFCIDVGAGVPARGKIDGCLVDKDDNLWLLEHKTKAQINEEALLMTIPRDLQVNLYMEAVFQITGKRPIGVIYNVVRRPALRKKKTENMKEFALRIKEDIATREDHYFKMFEIIISEEENLYQVSLIKAEIKRFRLWHTKTVERQDPQHTHNCSGVYGMCPYIGYCNSDKQDTSSLTKRKKLFSELEDANKPK